MLKNISIRRALFFLALLLLVLPIGANAQSDEPPTGRLRPLGARNYLGIEIGVDYSALLGGTNWFIPFTTSEGPIISNRLDFTTEGSGLGALIGLVGDIPLSEQIGLQWKLRYTSLNASRTELHTGSCPTFPGNPSLARFRDEYSASWNFGGADLLMRFQLNPNAYYLLGGIGISGLLRTKLSGTQTIDSGDASCQYADNNGNLTGFKSVTISQRNFPNMNYFRADIKFGLGTFIPLSHSLVLSPEILASYPLTKLYDQVGNDFYSSQSPAVTPPKLWYIAISVGLKFPFGPDRYDEPPMTVAKASYVPDLAPNVSTQLDVDSSGRVWLHGNVIDKKTGKPVEANMTVVQLGSNEIVNTGRTVGGVYDLKARTPGKYSVTADANGYLFGTAYFEVDQNGRIRKGNHDIKLSETVGRTRLLVFFQFDKSELEPASYPELNRAVVLLKAYPSMAVEIAGYTDSVGTHEYNTALALRRANAVRDYILKSGIEDSRITAHGYGEDTPIAPNDTEEGRAENRRVEFVVLHK
jgi:outer membrane protein OmpA-like peptidoglycan-associated protein